MHSIVWLVCFACCILGLSHRSYYWLPLERFQTTLDAMSPFYLIRIQSYHESYRFVFYLGGRRPSRIYRRVADATGPIFPEVSGKMWKCAVESPWLTLFETNSETLVVGNPTMVSTLQWKPWLMFFDGAEHMISIVWCRPSMLRFSNLHTNPLKFERWCLLVGWAQVVHISTDEWCLPHPGPKQRGCELLRCSTLAARWTKPSGDSGHLFYFTDLFWRQ